MPYGEPGDGPSALPLMAIVFAPGTISEFSDLSGAGPIIDRMKVKARLLKGAVVPLGALVATTAIVLAACSGTGVQIDLTGVNNSAHQAALPLPSPINPSIVSSFPTVQVVQKVAPAVVNVTTRQSGPSGFFGGNGGSSGVGTGFIIRSDGVIVTNFHVVEEALSIKVTLPPPSGRTFAARVIGGDSDHDLAVL